LATIAGLSRRIFPDPAQGLYARQATGFPRIDECENASQLLLVTLDAQLRVTPSAVHQSRQLGCTVESFTSADLLAYWKANGIAADRCWYSCAELATARGA
jgi:hypothetical protein